MVSPPIKAINVTRCSEPGLTVIYIVVLNNNKIIGVQRVIENELHGLLNLSAN